MKRINKVIDCILITQLCTAVSAVLVIVADRLDRGVYAVSPDLAYFCIVPACIIMLTPIFVWYDRLNNQCADDEQQAVLDITETIRISEEPCRWAEMWREIRTCLSGLRKHAPK